MSRPRSVLVAAGLVSATIVLLAARAPLESLRTLLDFLLGAGLVHLTLAQSWSALAAAAAIVLIRRIAGRGLTVATTVLGRPAGVEHGDAGAHAEAATTTPNRPARRPAHRERPH